MGILMNISKLYRRPAGFALKRTLSTHHVNDLTELIEAFNLPKRSEELTTRDVYCTGPLLEAVQQANLFSSSKVFVNKRMKFPVSDIMSNFNNLTKNYGGRRPAHESLRMFVEENFENVKELESWLPPDWVPHPPGLKDIPDEKLRSWLTELNTIWKTLCSRVTYDVAASPQSYSFIPLPKSFILSNIKKNELVYWDAYWIIKGLLMCGMHISAKDIIENLLFLVEKYGYIPKGNRIYYEGRSGPPMLGMIMETFLEHSIDFDFIRKNIHLLEREVNYWKNNRSIIIEKDGIAYEMYHYSVKTKGARPEAYREDILSGTLANTEEELQEHFQNVQSASESGWSFSTRWFVVHGFNHGNRSNTETRNLIPVDLNAFMHRNLVLLYRWYARMGQREPARAYWLLAEELLTAIEHVLWSEEHGIWQDYDFSNHKSRNYFYLSNITPLWTKSYRTHPEIMTGIILEYLNACNVDKYEGGVPTSIEYSGEVWDFPNVWPPLQYFLINGLERLHTPVASEIAFHFADKFISSNYKAYNEHGTIFPSYDCITPGRYGIGLDTMEASSCTMGVIFGFFKRWGKQFKIKDKYE